MLSKERQKYVVRDGDRFILNLSRTQMIHLRRCINRGIDCSEGRCPGYTIQIWYCMKTLVGQIKDAMNNSVAR